MFFELLRRSEQEAFTKISRLFVEADGYFSIEEQKMLASFAHQTRRRPSRVMREVPTEALEELLAVFDSPRSRACVVLELIWLGHADGEFSALKNQFVQKVASSFQIPGERLSEMADWVEEMVQRYREASRFWEG